MVICLLFLMFYFKPQYIIPFPNDWYLGVFHIYIIINGATGTIHIHKPSALLWVFLWVRFLEVVPENVENFGKHYAKFLKEPLKSLSSVRHITFLLMIDPTKEIEKEHPVRKGKPGEYCVPAAKRRECLMEKEVTMCIRCWEGKEDERWEWSLDLAMWCSRLTVTDVVGRKVGLESVQENVRQEEKITRISLPRSFAVKGSWEMGWKLRAEW